jgi:hypothetical protein
MEAAEKSRWDLANTGKIFGLENRRKSCHFMSDDICSPFYSSLFSSNGDTKNSFEAILIG